MRRLSAGPLLLILVLLGGCAAAPTIDHVSRPEVLETSNAVFEIQLKPIKLDNPFYVGFQLTIKNKSSGDLSIDWDETHYVHNGEDQGVFVFKGIDPKSVSSGIPKETIMAGDTLTRPIYPVKKLGFFRKRDRPKPGQNNFFPGILPNGENAALVAVEQGDRRWKELMSFRFLTRQTP
jgi:hypothetical protein